MMLTVSCHNASHDGYHIHGYVTDSKLNGAQVFLVPLENAVKGNIDSVVIKDQRFEFEGDTVRMADIRIERQRRIGTQNLLVLTEPGDIYATISQVSSSYGTPQNDSLQMWKEWLEVDRSQGNILRASGQMAAADSVHRAFRLRTVRLTENLPAGPLKEFFKQYYPLPK